MSVKLQSGGFQLVSVLLSSHRTGNSIQHSIFDLKKKFLNKYVLFRNRNLVDSDDEGKIAGEGLELSKCR